MDSRGQILGWTGMIRVDGATYTWMGAPNPQPTLVTQKSFEYTSTRSTFTMSAGAVEMNITFLSPLTPTDLKRQSLPFSYVNVAVSSADGKPHDVELYTDITAGKPVPLCKVAVLTLPEWASGDRFTVAKWEYGVTPATPSRRSRHRRQNSNSTSAGVAYHKFYRQTQLLFSEVAEQSEYGNWYWATDNVDSLTHQSGSDVQVRSAFRNTGALANTNDNNFRAINDAYPTFGFAVGLGKVGSAPVSTLFTLGHAQEEAIQFDGANGIVSLPTLWTSYYATELDAVSQYSFTCSLRLRREQLSFFHNDYATAAGIATTFDSKVASDSSAAGGQNYVTMTSLAARQSFGATQLAGTPDTPYLFLKEISSDGNVQTVDVIFPSHPIFLYTNPNLLKILLDPLFINQESGQYPNQYSMHDLGSHYPNATGHPAGNDEAQPLEECGNMLIMTLAYAQRTSDTAYLSQHYNILNQWTQYLIEEALIPANQISTDDFAGALAYVHHSNPHSPTNHPFQQPNEPRPQRHHRYRSHGRHRQSNRSYRRRKQLHRHRPRLHHQMAVPRHRTRRQPAAHDARLRHERDARQSLQPLRRQGTQARTGPSVRVRHAKRLLPDHHRGVWCTAGYSARFREAG